MDNDYTLTVMVIIIMLTMRTPLRRGYKMSRLIFYFAITTIIYHQYHHHQIKVVTAPMIPQARTNDHPHLFIVIIVIVVMIMSFSSKPERKKNSDMKVGDVLYS